MKQSHWNLWFILSIFWFMIHIAMYLYPDTPPRYIVLDIATGISIFNLIGCIAIGCQPSDYKEGD